PNRCAKLDHGNVFASARRQHTDRWPSHDEPRPPHRGWTRLSASLSNGGILARPTAARSPAPARSFRRTFIEPLTKVRSRSQRLYLFWLSGRTGTRSARIHAPAI